MVAATGCGPHLRAARDASQSFVHLPLLTELRHVAKGVRLILNPSSLLIQGYTAVAVWSCAPSRLKLSWSVAFNFLVFGVIFPLTHGITENFRRRERVCAVLTELGASCTATYWAHRDWAMHCRDGIVDGTAAAAELATTVAAITDYLDNVRLLVSCDSSAAEEASLACMGSLSALTACNERLGARVGYKMGGEGGMSRLAQYIRMLVLSTLSLKDVRVYAGTPHVMRYFVTVMNYLSPVLLAPYWRSFCAAEDARVTQRGMRDDCPGGYFSASLYCIIISSLYMVTRGVEDVLDGFGLDDVRYDQDVRFAELVALDKPLNGTCLYLDEVGVEVAKLHAPDSHR